MIRLLGYEPETNTFTDLTYPENINPIYEYELHFTMTTHTPKDLYAEHYVYCKSFNDLTRVLHLLHPMLANSDVKSYYAYAGDRQSFNNSKH